MLVTTPQGTALYIELTSSSCHSTSRPQVHKWAAPAQYACNNTSQALLVIASSYRVSAMCPPALVPVMPIMKSQGSMPVFFGRVRIYGRDHSSLGHISGIIIFRNAHAYIRASWSHYQLLLVSPRKRILIWLRGNYVETACSYCFWQQQSLKPGDVWKWLGDLRRPYPTALKAVLGFVGGGLGFGGYGFKMTVQRVKGPDLNPVVCRQTLLPGTAWHSWPCPHLL